MRNASNGSLIACTVAWLYALATGGVAQSYPNRPIRIIVPLALGGGTDVGDSDGVGTLRDAGGQALFVVTNDGGRSAYL